MIKTETIGNTIRTFSTLGMKIHGGFPVGDYDEAFDPIDSPREYTETDIPIETEEDAETILKVLTGETE